MIRTLIVLFALLVSGVAHAALNLNTATKDELIALPGIGPAKAQAIIEYRNQHGPFRTVDELRKVKGIGEKLFMQIRQDVSVGGRASSQAVAKAADGKGEAKGDAPRTSNGVIARDDKARK